MKRDMPLVVLLALMAVAESAAYVEPREAFSVGGGIGRLEVDGAPPGHDAGRSLDFNVTYRFRPRFAMALDIEAHGQNYATPGFVQPPFFGTVDDQMNISTASVTLQGLYSVPFWRTRLHLGAGAGLYRSRLVLNGTLLGIPGTVADQTDNDFGTHLLARWDIRVKRDWWVGAEYRRIDAPADFGRWTNGDIDVGGVVRYLTLRRQFAPPRWPPARADRP